MDSKKVYTLLVNDHRSDIVPSTNGFIHLACKGCGEDIHRSGVYSPKSNLYRCFQPGCLFHKWGSIAKYISYYRSMNLSSVEDLVGRQRQTYLDESFYTYKSKSYAKVIELPDGCIPITLGNTLLFKKMSKYLNKRGFNLSWLYDNYRLYYIQESYSNGKHNRYFGKIIIPFYDIYGDLVYFQARDYLGTSDLRWDNPPSKTTAGKDQVLFNIKSLYNDKAAVGTIHEGVFDALEMEKPEGKPIYSCSIGGLSISPYQLFLLAYSKCRDYYVVLDPGTWSEGLDIALAISLMCDKNVYVVELKGGDANELGKTKVLQHFTNADKFSSTWYTEQQLTMIRDGHKTYKNKETKKFKIFNF